MMNILDCQVVEKALWAELSDEYIRETVHSGHWSGMPVPGTSEWEVEQEGLPNHRLYVLGLAQYTRRHPAADPILIAIAADVVHYHETGWSGPYPIEEDPRHDRASAWVLAVAGGYPALPGHLGIFSFTPPIDQKTNQAVVPGGRSRFSRFAVEFVDRLLFASPEAAEAFAGDYLALYREDPIAQRANVIFSHVKRWQYTSPGIEGPATCYDCGATKLEHWYTAKSSGYQVCTECFERRARAGRAREVEA